MINFKEEYINPLITELILRQDLLGYLLMQFDITINNKMPYPAAITKDKIMYINVDLIKELTDIAKVTLTDKIFNTLFLHETLHIALRHFDRQQRRNQEHWNVVTDAELNTVLKDDYKDLIDIDFLNETSILPNKIFNMDVIETLTRPPIAEEMYDLLPPEIKFESTYKVGNPLDKEGAGNTSSNVQSNGASSGNVQIVQLPKGTAIVPKKGQQGVEGVQNDVSVTIKQAMQTAITQQAIHKQRGNHSMSILEKLLVKIKQNNVLAQYLKQILKRLDDAIGQNYGNRSFLRKNYIIPKFPGVKKQQKQIKAAVIVVDESGSMASSVIAEALSEIEFLCRKKLLHYKELYLIRHDVEASNPEKLTQGFKNYIRKKMGGTSHVEVFEKLKELKIKLKGDLGVIIFITDGASDIETIDWKELDNIYRFWLITDDPEQATKESLKEESKFTKYDKLLNI